MSVGRLDVHQPVSLDKAYAPPPSSGQLRGQSVQQGSGGIDRTTQPQTGWERFTDRVSHKFSRMGDAFCGKDTTADRRAQRFNAQHEQFSKDVHSLVGQLKSGDTKNVSNHEVLSTLRNEARLMRRDVEHVAKGQALSTRMDVELSSLSDTDLQAVKDSLSGVSREGLSKKDLRMLDTMLTSVVKHELARGDKTTALLQHITSLKPGVDGDRELLMTRLGDLQKTAEKSLTDLGVKDPKGMAGGILNDIAKLRLQHDGSDGQQMKVLNEKLLDVGQTLQLSNPKGRGAYDMERQHPLLRDVSRGVRDSYLKSLATTYTDDKQLSRNVTLGAGAVHVVTRATYQVGTQQKEMVHKFDDPRLDKYDNLYAMAAVKLQRSDPRLLERAVFASHLDKELGFNASVGTEFAQHQGEVGIVMEKAGGKTAHSISSNQPPISNPNDKELQRGLINLQLEDAILGQGDRHGGNYLIDVAPDGSVRSVKGIDNDFCMGLTKTQKDSAGLPATVGLPPIIDSDMYKAVMAMDDSTIDRLANGMFSKEVLDDAKARLKEVKDHCTELQKQGKVIDPDHWGTTQVTKILEETRRTETPPHGRTSTSYWQRDKHHFQEDFDPFGI